MLKLRNRLSHGMGCIGKLVTHLILISYDMRLLGLRKAQCKLHDIM
jgi:hypothetical protein